MKTERSLEQIEADYRRRVYGTCQHCKHDLEFDDKFVDVSQGVCGSSQGFPEAYIDQPERYHVNCYHKMIDAIENF